MKGKKIKERSRSRLLNDNRIARTTRPPLHQAQCKPAALLQPTVQVYPTTSTPRAKIRRGVQSVTRRLHSDMWKRVSISCLLHRFFRQSSARPAGNLLSGLLQSMLPSQEVIGSWLPLQNTMSFDFLETLIEGVLDILPFHCIHVNCLRCTFWWDFFRGFLFGWFLSSTFTTLKKNVSNSQ